MFNFLIGNDLLSSIIAFVLVLIPAILVHEIGHFLAGKSVRITILEFGIGMPPKLATLFTRGETEYTLNWLPLGGFVRPLGEDVVRQVGDAATEQARDVARARGITNPKTVNEAKPLERIWFLAAGALANFIFAVLLFTIVALIGIPEIVGGRVVVSDVRAESALAQAGLQPGDYIERINGDTFADSSDFIERLYALNGQPVTLDVQRAPEGSDPNAIIETVPAQIHVTPDFDASDPSLADYPVILGVAEGSPAAEAGMVAGDLVEEFNGQRITTFTELRTMTQENIGQEISLTLRRGDETVDVSLTPRENPPEGQGSMGIVSSDAAVHVDAVSGLAFHEGPLQEVLVSQSLPNAIAYGFARVGDVLATIARVPAEILAGTLTPEAARPVSVVGIGQMGGVFLQQSVLENQPTIILNFIAIISVALGLTNLLPLPALDGGRIFFVLLEIVRGRPVAPEREGFVHLVGLAILLSAMVVFILNDLVNPVTDLIR